MVHCTYVGICIFSSSAHAQAVGSALIASALQSEPSASVQHGLQWVCMHGNGRMAVEQSTSAVSLYVL